MKKILMLIAGAMLASTAFASPTALTAGGSTGSTTTVGATTGGTIHCSALSTETDTAPVKVGLSKENIGAIDCSATDIGVGVASTKGKAKLYKVSSGGGSEVEAACAGTPCVDTDVTGAATAALNSAS